jgi:hypothetical protein
MKDISYFQNISKLAPQNTFFFLKEQRLYVGLGEEKTYLSNDTPYWCNLDSDIVDDVHKLLNTISFSFFFWSVLNTISTSGIPNRKFRLKFECKSCY